MGKMKRHDQVSKYLELVGVKLFARHRHNQLSDGQRQKVSIARALAAMPGIVLADEPTANLDHKTGESIHQLMKRIYDGIGTTFVFSTLDLRVMEMVGRIVRLDDGELIQQTGSVACRGLQSGANDRNQQNTQEYCGAVYRTVVLIFRAANVRISRLLQPRT